MFCCILNILSVQYSWDKCEQIKDMVCMWDRLIIGLADYIQHSDSQHIPNIDICDFSFRLLIKYTDLKMFGSDAASSHTMSCPQPRHNIKMMPVNTEQLNQQSN